MEDLRPQHKLVLEWFDRVWNRQEPGAIEALCSPSMVVHTGAEPLVGPAAYRSAVFEPFAAAFASFHVRVLDVLVDGDKVGFRMTFHATSHEGEALEFSGGAFVRYEDSLIAEAWNYVDFYALLAGTGDVPADGLAKLLTRETAKRKQ